MCLGHGSNNMISQENDHIQLLPAGQRLMYMYMHSSPKVCLRYSTDYLVQLGEALHVAIFNQCPAQHTCMSNVMYMNMSCTQCSPQALSAEWSPMPSTLAFL